MRLTLFYNETVHANAARYYELAKEGRAKAAGLETAMKETEKELGAAKKDKKKEVRHKRDKEWYGKFHFSFTSGGKLLLGGRNAQQNDLLFAKHTDDADLFYHADIQGASAVILKGGAELLAAGDAAARAELAEAAQFAASFSKAWVNGNASVDVYAVLKSQVSKHATGGFVPSGAFAISGERTWFRDTKLALRIGIGEKGLTLVPDVSTTKLQNALVLVPSLAGKEKGALARSLSKRYGVHPDELLELLPNGKTKTLEKS
jgi:predicted ribosome quality control (RQC) complex YloA/Tae2 family protein